MESIQSEIDKSATPSTGALPKDPPFNSAAQKVLDDARQEAQRAGSDVVDSEHLLLSLLQQTDNCAIEILRALKIEPRRLRAQVEQMAQYAPKKQQSEQPLSLYTAFADKAIELINKAKEECSRSGRRMVGSEHCLLAMVAGDFLGGERLRQMGITAEKMSALVEMLPGEPQTDSANQDCVERFELTRALEQAFFYAVATQEMVGTCHIMLAMIKLPDSRAAQVLSGMSVDLVELANDVEQLLAFKREEAANLGQTLGATVKSVVADASEASRSLPAKLKLDIEELLARIDFEHGHLNTAAKRFQQLILFRAGDQSPVGEQRLRRLQHHLALVYIKQARYDDAQAVLERALNINAPASVNPDVTRAELLNNMALLLILQGKTKEAKPYLEESMSVVGNSNDYQSRRLKAQLQSNFGECLRADGDLDSAGALLHASLDSQSKLLAPDDPQLAFIYINLGKLLMSENRLSESSESFGKALSLQGISLDPDHPDIGNTLINYIPLLETMKRHDLAASARSQVEAIRSKQMEGAPSGTPV